MVPVRWREGESRVVRADMVVKPGHWLHDAPCMACDEPITEATPVALVYIGPGNSEDDREAARAGRWHTGAAVPIHAACAGVEALIVP